MSKSLLSIKPSSSEAQKITPNLLPCSIKHSGPIGPVPTSFWNPRQSSSSSSSLSETGNKQTSYFRGRKLNGKSVPLPEGYKGVVASTREQKEEGGGDDDVIDLEKEESGSLEVQGEFEELVIWGLEGGETVGDDNVYVRGVEEWVGVAGAVHSFGGEAKR
ncbi:ribonuclease H2, subunit C [Cladorrhinum sp. PSN332]|nr:ribonuclease H2, subunit C [Cladorrhinum sp. PSN332]